MMSGRSIFIVAAVVIVTVGVVYALLFLKPQTAVVAPAPTPVLTPIPTHQPSPLPPVSPTPVGSILPATDVSTPLLQPTPTSTPSVKRPKQPFIICDPTDTDCVGSISR